MTKDNARKIVLGGMTSNIIVSNVAGAFPSSTSSSLSSDFSSGLAKSTSTLPAVGKLKGTRMVLKQTSKLQKTRKRF